MSPSFCAAAAIGFTGNPTIPNMNLTPCRLRLLATKVAPSTSLMRSLLSEWGSRPHDITLDLVLDPVGVDRRRRARRAGRSVAAALSGPNRARRRELLAQDVRRLWGGPAGELAVLEPGEGGAQESKAVRRRQPLVLSPGLLPR